MRLLIFNKLLLPVVGANPNSMNNGSPWKGCSWLCVHGGECWQPHSNSVQVALQLPASPTWELFFAQWCKTLTPLAVWGENHFFPDDGEIPVEQLQQLPQSV